jgi:hypothetical protein
MPVSYLELNVSSDRPLKELTFMVRTRSDHGSRVKTAQGKRLCLTSAASLKNSVEKHPFSYSKTFFSSNFLRKIFLHTKCELPGISNAKLLKNVQK